MCYLKQVEQLWLTQLPQPEDELVILPWLSLELKAKLETSRLKSLLLQRGQTIESLLLRTK